MKEIILANLHKLYDEKKGGFFWGVRPDGSINRLKLLRYNARIIDLLDLRTFPEMVVRTAEYIIGLQTKNGRFYYSSEKKMLANIGDVALATNVLIRYGFTESARLSMEYLSKEKPNVKNLKEPCQISWFLELVNDKKITDFLLKEKLKKKRLGISYVDFPTIVYVIHTLIKFGRILKARTMANFLIDKMQDEKGEWKLAYFPLLKSTYAKAFSVHQLGMAPIYLLELYEKVDDKRILNAVLKGVEYGKKFIGKDRIFRTLKNQEMRCYECAFDLMGMKMVSKYV